VRRPRNKWGTQKLASTWSWFLINTTPRKVGIWKTKEQKRRGRQVPKTKLRSVLKIPEDPLDGWPIWSPRRCLKTSAQTHRKLDVRPRRRQVQEGVDHAPVLLLVHGISVVVHVQCYSHTHRCRQGLRVFHPEHFEDILRLFSLMHKGSLLRLLDWSLRKNYNSPIIDISNSLLMSSVNLTTKVWD
jgi:hypothetical protein